MTWYMFQMLLTFKRHDVANWWKGFVVDRLVQQLEGVLIPANFHHQPDRVDTQLCFLHRIIAGVLFQAGQMISAGIGRFGHVEPS